MERKKFSKTQAALIRTGGGLDIIAKEIEDDMLKDFKDKIQNAMNEMPATSISEVAAMVAFNESRTFTIRLLAGVLNKLSSTIE